MTSRTRTALVLGAVGALGITGLAVAISLVWCMNTSGLRRALPSSATEVHEEVVDLFPDATTYLKAKLPERDFPLYVKRLGLTPHTPGRQYDDDEMWLGWGMGSDPPWWDPTPSLEGTYVAQSGHAWTLAKHEQGYLFVLSFTH